MKLPEPARALYPFHTRRLEVDGVGLNVLDEGAADAPPILLLHGNPTWSLFWRALVPELARTHRVIAPDHAGCGLSDRPTGYPYNLDRHARNVAGVADQLGLRDITLVVHDWGGPIGLVWAARHPDRLTRLVVCNTAAFLVPDLPLGIRLCRWPVLGPLAIDHLNLFVRLALRWAAARPGGLPPAVRQAYAAPFARRRDREAVLRFVQDIPLEPRHPSRAVLAELDPFWPRLAELPALVIWGGRDFCFSQRHSLSGWRARLPQAQVELLPQAGHWLMEDEPDAVTRLVRAFVAETGR